MFHSARNVKNHHTVTRGNNGHADEPVRMEMPMSTFRVVCVAFKRSVAGVRKQQHQLQCHPQKAQTQKSNKQGRYRQYKEFIWPPSRIDFQRTSEAVPGAGKKGDFEWKVKRKQSCSGSNSQKKREINPLPMGASQSTMKSIVPDAASSCTSSPSAPQQATRTQPFISTR